jgi:transposase
LNPFEYLAWIFRNAPNIGRKDYVNSYEDLLPGSEFIPESVFTPKPNDDAKKEKEAWEEV